MNAIIIRFMPAPLVCYFTYHLKFSFPLVCCQSIKILNGNPINRLIIPWVKLGYDIIRQSLEKTKLLDQAHIYCGSVAKAVSFLNNEYNILLMDPPYANPAIGCVVTHVATSKLVGPSSTIVVTHSPHLLLDSPYATFGLVKERRHGDSCIAIYPKGGCL